MRLRRMRSRAALLLPASVLIALGIATPSADAANDMFLKLEGIDGESRDSTHKGEIDVLAWSWGASRGPASDKKHASPSENLSIQNLSLTKFVDKASPELLESLLTGDATGSGKLTVRKAGETPVEYLKFCMEDVTVTAVSTGGSGGEDRLTENITLNFSQFRYQYTPQDAKGKELAPIFTGWDVLASELVNQKCD
jgi:type VI secretion system secreted protein Hcp